MCPNLGHFAIQKINLLQQLWMDFQFCYCFSFRIVIYYFLNIYSNYKVRKPRMKIRAGCPKLGHNTIHTSVPVFYELEFAGINWTFPLPIARCKSLLPGYHKPPNLPRRHSHPLPRGRPLPQPPPSHCTGCLHRSPGILPKLTKWADKSTTSYDTLDFKSEIKNL